MENNNKQERTACYVVTFKTSKGRDCANYLVEANSYGEAESLATEHVLPLLPEGSLICQMGAKLETCDLSLIDGQSEAEELLFYRVHTAFGTQADVRRLDYLLVCHSAAEMEQYVSKRIAEEMDGIEHTDFAVSRKDLMNYSGIIRK